MNKWLAMDSEQNWAVNFFSFFQIFVLINRN